MEGGGVNRSIMKPLRAVAAIITLGISMNAFGFLGLGGTTWKEEVLLHDGSKIIVERHKERHGRHEIGQKPPTGDQSIEFTIPGTNRTLTWRDEYSEDVGSANFNLIALHILNGTPFVVTTAYGCLSYNKWGRPNPPYILFKHDGRNWQRVQISELPKEFQTINLVANDSREREIEEAAKGLGYVPASVIAKLNSSLTQPHYRSIVREPLAASELCPPELTGFKAPIPIPPKASEADKK